MAHGDYARRAVLAALGLQRSLRGGGSQPLPGPPLGEDLTVRMGLNTGLVVVGSIGDNLRMDYTAIGDTTNLAARLQQVAEPDTILISETTRRLVQSAIRLEALPAVQVKGKAEPVTRYKVLGLGPRRAPLSGREGRALSPFVGRERELTTLEELLVQVEGGQGQVVSVVGEAGVGKSRLLYEFRQRVAGKRVTYLEGRCLSYGSAMPYHPIIDIIRHNCGITDISVAVFLASFDPTTGSEQAGRRPVLVISRERVHQLLPVVNVIPLTSRKSLTRIIYPNEVLLPAGTAGLRVDSIALCYQIRTLDKSRLEQELGELVDVNLRQELLHAIRFQLQL